VINNRAKLENWVMQPFYKVIKPKYYKVLKQNEKYDYESQKNRYCELKLPKYWCNKNGLDDSINSIHFTSSTLQSRSEGEKDMKIDFNMARLPNTHNFTTKVGWKEFLELHGIELGWKLKFIPDPTEGRGATYLKVQRIMDAQYGCSIQEI
jgi:hypothetical protein